MTAKGWLFHFIIDQTHSPRQESSGRGSEQVDGAVLLYRVPGEQHPPAEVREGHRAVGVAEDLQPLQRLVPAAEPIPLAQRVELCGGTNQMPVLFVEPGLGEVPQAPAWSGCRGPAAPAAGHR